MQTPCPDFPKQACVRGEFDEHAIEFPLSESRDRLSPGLQVVRFPRHAISGEPDTLPCIPGHIGLDPQNRKFMNFECSATFTLELDWQSAHLGKMDVAVLQKEYHVLKDEDLQERAKAATLAGRDFYNSRLTIWWSATLQAPVRILAEGGDTPNFAHTMGSPYMDLPGHPAQLDLIRYSLEERPRLTNEELVNNYR